MVKKTQKQISIKQWWAIHGDIVLACVVGFILGLGIAIGSDSRGYLLERMTVWRNIALNRTVTQAPVHNAAPMINVRVPRIVVFNVAEEMGSSSAEPEMIIDSEPVAQPVNVQQVEEPVVLPTVPAVAPPPAVITPRHEPMTPQVQSSSSKPAQKAIVNEPPVHATPVIPQPKAVKEEPVTRAVETPVPPAPQSPAAAGGVGNFPAFGRALYPVSKIPDWGNMHSAAEWNRTYGEMSSEDFTPVPDYNMQKLMTPFKSLLNPRDDGEITRKLFYSTHYFGAYDLDAGEFTAVHPGIDLKLAIGTPLGAIAGGRVNVVENAGPLGLHAIIEHRIGGKTYYSIYGHLGLAAVKAGQDVTPGQFIGTVGMTGNTSGPHLHLQVDIGHGEAIHTPYLPSSVPSPGEAAQWVMNPITFIRQYADGN